MIYIVANQLIQFQNFCRLENIAIARLVQTTKQGKAIGRVWPKDVLILLEGYTETEIGRIGRKGLSVLKRKFHGSGAEIRYINYNIK